jgi:dienelactone hydrolase
MVRVAGKHDAYLASPPADKEHKGAGILLLPDVIGIWENSQLIADQFAANGYLTLLLDTFNGDPLKLNRPADFDFMAWVSKGSDGNNPHTKEAVDPIVVDGIQALKGEYGITKLGAVGYCFGAKVRRPWLRKRESLTYTPLVRRPALQRRHRGWVCRTPVIR